MIIKRLPVGVYAANCYILADEESKEGVVIDAGGEADKIYKVLNQLGVKLKYIILTHAHVDHISAVEDLKKLTGATTLIHKKDSEMLIDPIKNLSSSMYGGIVSFSADRELVDGDIIEFGNLKLKVIHTPGHTLGGICLYDGDKTLITGDTLFALSIGRSDLYGGDHDTLIKSIKNKLMCLDDDVQVFPGHGTSSSIGIERKKNPFL